MVVIYGKDACPYCDRARELCEQFSITYEYRSLDDRFEGPAYLIELKQLADETGKTFKTVPQIWWNNEHVGGFDDFAVAIENRGIGNFGQGEF